LSIYRELQLQEKAVQVAKGELPHSQLHLAAIQDYKPSGNIIIQETFAEGMVICPGVLAHIFGRVSYNPATLELVSCLCNRVDSDMSVLICMEIPSELYGQTWEDLVTYYFDDDEVAVTPIGLNRLFFDDTGVEDSYVDGDPCGRVLISMPPMETEVKEQDYLVCLCDYGFGRERIVLHPPEGIEDTETHEVKRSSYGVTGSSADKDDCVFSELKREKNSQAPRRNSLSVNHRFSASGDLIITNNDDNNGTSNWNNSANKHARTSVQSTGSRKSILKNDIKNSETETTANELIIPDTIKNASPESYEYENNSRRSTRARVTLDNELAKEVAQHSMGVGGNLDQSGRQSTNLSHTITGARTSTSISDMKFNAEMETTSKTVGDRHSRETITSGEEHIFDDIDIDFMDNEQTLENNNGAEENNDINNADNKTKNDESKKSNSSKNSGNNERNINNNNEDIVKIVVDDNIPKKRSSVGKYDTSSSGGAKNPGASKSRKSVSQKPTTFQDTSAKNPKNNLPTISAKKVGKPKSLPMSPKGSKTGAMTGIHVESFSSAISRDEEIGFENNNANNVLDSGEKVTVDIISPIASTASQQHTKNAQQQKKGRNSRGMLPSQTEGVDMEAYLKENQKNHWPGAYE